MNEPSIRELSDAEDIAIAIIAKSLRIYKLMTSNLRGHALTPGIRNSFSLEAVLMVV